MPKAAMVDPADPMVDLNTTPLIDVMLVLLVMRAKSSIKKVDRGSHPGGMAHALVGQEP